MRSLILISALLLVLSPFSPLTVSCLADEYSVARIVDVIHPKNVSVGETFQVVVTAEYADSLYVDIGIRDVERDEVVEALTLISNFHGPGLESYRFNLTAPESEGVWRLEASTRAWWKGSWYGDREKSTYRFDINVMAGKAGLEGYAMLSIISHAQGVQLTVDDVEYKLLNNSLTLKMKEGPHYLAVNPSIVDFDNGTRLIFSRWNDNVSSNPRRIILSSKGLVLSPIYRRQYHLQIDSPPKLVRGEGWYDEGSEALIEALPEAYDGNLLYRFKGWRGDVSSMDSSLRILMDRPKRVEASWIKEAYVSRFPGWILTVSAILFMLSIINIAIIALRNRSKSKAATALLLLLILFLGSNIVEINASANSLRPSYTIVEIGNSKWRYWHPMGSDTCLIWLGGGVFGDQTFINPYWLESYNTMRFIQDLSKFYSILAIEEGSTKHLQKPLNRIVYGESYRGGGFVEEARRWAASQGFSQIYLIGYSVGGIAAAEESIIHHPQEWSSPNGVILITTPISGKLLGKAGQFAGNLLILYGERMTPLYVRSGENFFNNSRSEGPFGNNWVHKEFHIIPETAHEVWTIAETGRYNPLACQVIVNFVEKAKLLNHLSRKGSIGELEEIERPKTLEISLKLIQRIDPYPWSAYINGSSLSPNLYDFMISKDGIDVIAVSYTYIDENKSFQVLLNLEKEALTQGGDIRILALMEGSNKFIDLGALNPPAVNLVILTGFPDVPIKVDKSRYLTDPSGRLILNLTGDLHRIELEKVIEFDNRTRLYFKGWDGGLGNETDIAVNSHTKCLTATYVRQFLIEATSEIGDVSGGGWYDENSLIQLKVRKQIIEGEDGSIYVFDGWHPEGSIEEDGTLYVDRPVTVKAVWREAAKPHHSPIASGNPLLLGVLLLPILILFLATAFLAISLKNKNSYSQDKFTKKNASQHEDRRNPMG